MFHLHKHRRMVISTLIAIAIILPTTIFAINKFAKTDSALAITYSIPDGYTTIIDPKFYNCVAHSFSKEFYLSESIPETGLTNEQLGKIQTLSCRAFSSDVDEKISDITGIEKMVALTHIDLRGNRLTSIDLSNQPNLTYLDLDSNMLTSIDLSNQPSLTYLNLDFNRELTSIDLSNQPNLAYLNLGYNKLTSIDLSNQPNLTYLDLDNNKLASIDLSNQPNLTELELSGNKLTSIDLSNQPNLTKLELGNNKLTSIDLSNQPNLTKLNLNSDNLASIDLSNQPNLTELGLSGNNLISIDLSNQPNLTKLSLSHNKLTSIDLRKNTVLKDLDLRMYDIPPKAIVNADLIKNNNTYLLRQDDILFLQAPKTYVEVLGQNLYTYDNSTRLVTILDKDNIDYIPVNMYDAIGSTNGSANLVLAHTITFDNNSGIGGPGETYCTAFGECTVTIPENEPTRNGYVFIGWGNTTNDTTASYQPGAKISISENKTLYAIWSPILTLSFNANGGSGNIAPQTCYNPTDITETCNITIPEDEPIRDGYSFFGWANRSDAIKHEYLSKDTIAISENKTIYAVWADGKVEWVDENKTHTKEDNNDLKVKINYPAERFSKLLIDGTEPNESYYAIESGSTILTLKTAYLDTLSEGAHTLELIYDNGAIANTTFMVSAPISPDSDPSDDGGNYDESGNSDSNNDPDSDINDNSDPDGSDSNNSPNSDTNDDSDSDTNNNSSSTIPVSNTPDSNPGTGSPNTGRNSEENTSNAAPTTLVTIIISAILGYIFKKKHSKRSLEFSPKHSTYSETNKK